MIAWAGPHEYPPVGMVAVTNSGERIEIWANESEDDKCFTGLLLKDGRTYGQRVIFDLSSLWMREAIDHIEEPTEDDLRLGWWREVAA